MAEKTDAKPAPKKPAAKKKKVPAKKAAPKKAAPKKPTSADVKPAKANWLTPYLTVRDADASLDFYQKAFGFTVGESTQSPEGVTIHAEMMYKRKIVAMFAPEGAFGGIAATPAHNHIVSAVNLYVYVDNVDALTERAREAGAYILAEPMDSPWGDRTALISDWDGHRWMFATKIKGEG
ncbi:VOC family protein [bacterium SCSIO 12696]|nr:VOC family protein [bacterium SCSIO 12696]